MAEIISAARYNELQGKIAALLGPGSLDKGYNQLLASSGQPVGTLILASHMNSLYTDFEKVWKHIRGEVSLSTRAINTVTSDNEITNALYTAYEETFDILEDERFLIHPTQVETVSAGVNSVRNGLASPWGGTSLPQQINHTIEVSFTSANARRCFCKACGEIRFNASLDISSIPEDTNYAKNEDWVTMLSNPGQIQFGRNVTERTLTGGTAYAIGNEDLTTTYQPIFLKTGDPSGTYSDNQWYIQAKEIDSSTIAFDIVFYDQDVGSGGADEYVAGVLTSEVLTYRSINYVDSPAPNYTKTSDL